jgi:hypothetical protein
MVTVIKPIFLVVIAGGFYVNSLSLRSLSKRQLVEENNEQGDTIEIFPVENESIEFTEQDQQNLVEFLEDSLSVDDEEPIDVTSDELKSLELADQEIVLDQTAQDDADLEVENFETAEFYAENNELAEEEQNVVDFFDDSIDEEPIQITTNELDTLELADQEIVLDQVEPEEISDDETDVVTEISETSDVAADILEFADEDSQLGLSNDKDNQLDEITLDEQLDEIATPSQIEESAAMIPTATENIDLIEFEPIEGVFENEGEAEVEIPNTPEEVIDAEQTETVIDEVKDSVAPEELDAQEVSEDPVASDPFSYEEKESETGTQQPEDSIAIENIEDDESLPLDSEITFESSDIENIEPVADDVTSENSEEELILNETTISEDPEMNQNSDDEIVENDYEVAEGILPQLSSEIAEIIEKPVEIDSSDKYDVDPTSDTDSDTISSLTEFEKLAAKAVMEDVLTAEAEAIIEQEEPEDYELIDDETLEALDQLEASQETVDSTPESLDTSFSNPTPDSLDSSNSLKQDITENTIPLPDLPIQNIVHHTPAQMTFDFLSNAHNFDFASVSKHLIRSFTLTIPNYNCLESGLPNLQLIEDRLTNKFIELGLLSATQDIFTVSDAKCGSLIVTFEVIEPQEVDAKLLIENHLTDAVRAIVDDEDYEHEAFLSEYQPSRADKLAFGLESKKKLVNLLLLEAMSNSQIGDALTLMYLQGRFEQGYDGQKEEMLLTMFLLNKKY